MKNLLVKKYWEQLLSDSPETDTDLGKDLLDQLLFTSKSEDFHMPKA